MRAISSKLLMVTSTPGLPKLTRWSRVVAEKCERHTKHCPSLSRHTPPMTIPEAYVAPNQEGGKGAILRR